MERFCSPDTLRRLFLRFNYREVTEVSERLMGFSLASDAPDSVGAHVGFGFHGAVSVRRAGRESKGRTIPTSLGVRSHHPLVAFLAEGRRLVMGEYCAVGIAAAPTGVWSL